MWLITGVIKWTRGAPYKIWEGKKRPKFSAIFNNFRLWSQISQEWIDISKIGKVLDQLHFIPYWAKKNLVKFGPLTTLTTACWPTQLDVFRKTIFRPQGALTPQIFTRPTSPINCISSRTWGAGRPQVGLCPIFLVLFQFQGCADAWNKADHRQHCLTAVLFQTSAHPWNWNSFAVL